MKENVFEDNVAQLAHCVGRKCANVRTERVDGKFAESLSTRRPCNHASGPSGAGQAFLPASSVSDSPAAGGCCLAGPSVARILVEILLVGADVIGRDK
ncbi:hypothetical protein KL932_001378 [Ogataea haglerorum]|uniref:uncharacterized protein n=1 Tax=Ogataea haglerorum TaxID=1937702 RepID=UPI001C8AC97F|nr:uncharacterized protein KL911_000225 [Ogataea haglerorum]KAG7699042.1 hypothetical protein KL915_001334 [Ogataea haglerorum]KAG7710084.1 hypothetical protein KL914_000994 [Ogataea haglerorum]KAG7740913.1 hypothetical protein KL923_001554 [Ogataea haglerorum]KAG7744055.1 hypothetical protein KL932_001378 [Ogataea haglerorum]KAG7759088.1 hypothetical protein KL911_000225 [Ogataea haglerorum]